MPSPADRFSGDGRRNTVDIEALTNAHPKQRCEHGVSKWELPTPALLVDLGALERNLDRMAAFYRGRLAALRPHCKTHKSPLIAKQQLARGAAGICVARLSEADGILTLRRPTREVKIGDRILLMASHCDPTVNLYDRYYVCRGDRVVDEWRVAARGMSQ